MRPEIEKRGASLGKETLRSMLTTLRALVMVHGDAVFAESMIGGGDR